MLKISACLIHIPCPKAFLQFHPYVSLSDEPGFLARFSYHFPVFLSF